MSHIVVTGKGIPTAANSRSVRGNALSEERVDRQRSVSAGSHRAFTAYSASKEMSADRDTAVSVDIPEGAMRVSRQLWEEYGDYPNGVSQTTSAVGEDGLQAVGQNGTGTAATGKTSETIGNEIVSGEIKEGEKTEEEVTEDTQKEGKKGKAYGITEEGLEYLERLLEQMKESNKANSKSGTKSKKALNYNYRRISSAISRAKNVNQASNALTSANSNLSSLRRKVASGQYKSNELQIAMTHAKKMVRVARKKVNNIKYEEQIDKRDNGIETDKERKNRQNLVVSKGSSITKKKEKQEKELRLMKRMLRQQRQQRKNAHRRGEGRDLINADMEYLRKKIDLIRQERQESSMERMAEFAARSSTMMAADATLQSAETGGGMTAAEVVQNGQAAEASGSGAASSASSQS